MTMFDFGGGGSLDFLGMLERRVTAMLEGHGLLKATDATSAASSSGPFALLSELESPEGYDDRPAIEKLLASISTAAKKMKLPQTHSFRSIGCHPDSCAAVLVIIGTYQPVAAANATDPSKLGRWSLAVRDPSGTKTHEGDVMDITSLVAALSELGSVCSLLQTQLNLTPIRRPSYADTGFMGIPGVIPAAAEG